MRRHNDCWSCDTLVMDNRSYFVPESFFQQRSIRRVEGGNTELAIAVPRPAGITGLPGYIYFNVSGEFNQDQLDRINRALNGIMYYWYLHFSQLWDCGRGVGLSQLGMCANANSTFRFQPTWYQGLPLQNGYDATIVAMEQFTQLIRDNGYGLSTEATITPLYTGQFATNRFVFAETATTEFNVPLSFQVSPQLLDDRSVSDQMLTGLFFYAWLHRAGFANPTTLPLELGAYSIQTAMCVMRGLQGTHFTSDVRFFS